LRAASLIRSTAAAVLLLGCGGSGSDSTAASDFGLPTVVSSGGAVLAAPRVQPIYLAGFPYKSEVDGFLQRLAASAYWSEVASEYGVGRPTIVPGDDSPIMAPATATLHDVVTLFGRELNERAAAIGRPRRDTIYTLFMPPTTTVTADSMTLCQEGGASGLHAEISVSGTPVPLVVIPTCASFAGRMDLTGLSALTPAISHELVETATDPFPESAPAYESTAPQYAMWAVALQGGEVADLCENEAPNLVTPADIGQPVQRIWSNRAVRAGTAPCVPVPAGEGYFNAVAHMTETVQTEVGGAIVRVPAVVAPAGSTATIKVDLRGGADAPSSWQVIAIEYHGTAALGGNMRVTPIVGQRGTTRTVQVAASGNEMGVFPLVLLSHSSAGALHFWVGAIARR
jgi:hypothetical protein